MGGVALSIPLQTDSLGRWLDVGRFLVYIVIPAGLVIAAYWAPYLFFSIKERINIETPPWPGTISALGMVVIFALYLWLHRYPRRDQPVTIEDISIIVIIGLVWSGVMPLITGQVSYFERRPLRKHLFRHPIRGRLIGLFRMGCGVLVWLITLTL